LEDEVGYIGVPFKVNKGSAVCVGVTGRGVTTEEGVLKLGKVGTVESGVAA
jgi:hypothetical protein